jgi:hypothetical protein
MSTKRKDIHATCHAGAMFYPGITEQFLEAVLNISEKVRGLARKRSANLNAGRSKGCRPATEPAMVACALLNSDET